MTCKTQSNLLIYQFMDFGSVLSLLTSYMKGIPFLKNTARGISVRKFNTKQKPRIINFNCFLIYIVSKVVFSHVFYLKHSTLVWDVGYYFYDFYALFLVGEFYKYLKTLAFKTNLGTGKKVQ